MLIGFAVAPAQAWRYWFGGTFGDLHRIAGVAYVGNASLRGELARLGLGPGPWIVLAAAIGAASLVVAAWADRKGEPLLAVTLVGMASTAVSPYSWPYHWVWFVPLAIWLARLAFATRSRTATLALIALLLATLSWPSDWPSAASGQMVRIGLTAIRTSAWPGQLVTNLYLSIFAITLVSTACWLQRSTRTDVVRPRVQPHFTSATRYHTSSPTTTAIAPTSARSSRVSGFMFSRRLRWRERD